MVIRILDHVAHCSTYADGDAIYQIIKPSFVKGEDVTLSFDGVDAVPSSFINASVVRLIESVSLDEIKAHLRVVDSTKQINDLIRGRIAFLGQSGTHTV
jgi:STAS-like domain of unknown function (DUF4325)